MRVRRGEKRPDNQGGVAAMECGLGDVTVYYEVFGEGKPILMLHGWSIDHHHMVSAMEPVFERREGWKRFYPDLPGHGGTPGAGWITDQDHMLEVIVRFIDAVIPGERFAIAGASAGGYLARGVVYRRSAWVDGLLLTVPAVVTDDSKRALPDHVTLAEDPSFISGLGPEEAKVIENVPIVAQSPEALEAVRSALRAGQMADHVFLSRIRQNPEKYAFSFDVDAPGEPFPAPTLIVVGRQDAICGYRDAWDILENYPRATFAVLDRAGHLLEAEQAGLYHALMDEWLDRVEEYATRPPT